MSPKHSRSFYLKGLLCLLFLSTSCLRQPQIGPPPSRNDPFLKTSSFIDGLRSEDPWIRVKSAEIAGTKGADAKDAVPLLIKMVAEPEEGVLFGTKSEERRTALHALRSIGV